VGLKSRLASREDMPVLAPLIEAAIDQLQQAFLDEVPFRSSVI
jgi:hypothetical protein